jgi:hypothetical protein
MLNPRLYLVALAAIAAIAVGIAPAAQAVGEMGVTPAGSRGERPTVPLGHIPSATSVASAARGQLDDDSIPVCWSVRSGRWKCNSYEGTTGEFGGITIGPDGRVYTAGSLYWWEPWDLDLVGTCTEFGADYVQTVWDTAFLNAPHWQHAVDIKVSGARNRLAVGAWGEFAVTSTFDKCILLSSQAGSVSDVDTVAFRGAHNYKSQVNAIATRDLDSERTMIWAVGSHNEFQQGFGSNIRIWCAVDSVNSLRIVNDTCRAGTSGAMDDVGLAIVPHPNGEAVYVAGQVGVAPDGVRFWIGAYNRTLDTLYWQTVWPDTAAPKIRPTKILYAPNGALYVVGCATEVGQDYLVVLELDRGTGAVWGSGWYDMDNGYECRDAAILRDDCGFSIWTTGRASGPYIATTKLPSDLPREVQTDRRQPNGRSAEGYSIWGLGGTLPILFLSCRRSMPPILRRGRGQDVWGLGTDFGRRVAGRTPRRYNNRETARPGREMP